MKVLVISDSGSIGRGYNLRKLVETTLQEIGLEVQSIYLNATEIEPCLGCFDCWVKTPGLYIRAKDSPNTVSRALIQSDAVVLLSKLTYGGFSPDTKALLDRCIANVSPYFQKYQGETHHRMRYPKYPSWIALGYGESTQAEQEIFKELAQRNAYNLHIQNFFSLAMPDAAAYPPAMAELKRIFREELKV